MRSYRIVSFTIAVFALILSFTNESRADDLTMTITGPSSPPIGHVVFCSDHAGECEAFDRADVVVSLTENGWRELVSVNGAVNAAVAPVTDLEAYGVSELWTYPTDVGDCEDYVLEKRRRLIERGWPASALLVTVVRDEFGDGHAVLTVRTSAGDIVLDNRSASILVWSDTPYLYIKRQSTSHAAAWEGIDDTRAPLVGSLGRY
jgi:predicted transglutaminase-like cysteine proteinase